MAPAKAKLWDRSHEPNVPMSERHSHVFLGDAHAESERNVWAVIALATAMMIVEIVGGFWFGSLALVADGFHMSTHAGALLLAALAYTLARRHAEDPAFTFGSGKFGDLAGYSSALILAVIALGIGVEAAQRWLAPRPIAFAQAIPIAVLGLAVNAASAWLLSRGGHHHHHHGEEHGHAHAHGEEVRELDLGGRTVRLEIFETGVPPRFRLRFDGAPVAGVIVETLRPGEVRQRFEMIDRGGYLESRDEIPEPHEFEVLVASGGLSAQATFSEGHGHSGADADHNMRAALLHVVADAAVSVLAIVGLSLAWAFGWSWMDPLAGLVGALVIASWSWQLIRDTGRVLLDMNPDRALCDRLRAAIERGGDELVDLHVWRLGPGHLGAIVSVATAHGRDRDFYRRVVRSLYPFSHLTVEVAERPARGGPPRLVA